MSPIHRGIVVLERLFGFKQTHSWCSQRTTGVPQGNHPAIKSAKRSLCMGHPREIGTKREFRSALAHCAEGNSRVCPWSTLHLPPVTKTTLTASSSLHAPLFAYFPILHAGYFPLSTSFTSTSYDEFMKL